MSFCDATGAAELVVLVDGDVEDEDNVDVDFTADLRDPFFGLLCPAFCVAMYFESIDVAATFIGGSTSVVTVAWTVVVVAEVTITWLLLFDVEVAALLEEPELELEEEELEDEDEVEEEGAALASAIAVASTVRKYEVVRIVAIEALCTYVYVCM